MVRIIQLVMRYVNYLLCLAIGAGLDRLGIEHEQGSVEKQVALIVGGLGAIGMMVLDHYAHRVQQGSKLGGELLAALESPLPADMTAEEVTAAKRWLAERRAQQN